MKEFVFWLQAHFLFFHDKAWIAEVFCIVLVTLVVAYIETLIFRRLHDKLKNSWTVWDDSLVFALHKPLHSFVWLLGFTVAADVVAYSGKYTAIFAVVEPVRNIGLIVLLAWFLLRFIQQAETNFIQRNTGSEKMDKTTVHALGKVFRIAVLVTTTLVALQTFGIGISGILAFGGIGGAAVAFSAKDLLANFFGGLMIYMDRPFAVGDWIRSPDREIEGTVEYIGWRLCRIRTFSKRPLYIPNAIFNSIAIENPSRMTNRRIKAFIGVRYDDAAKLRVILKDVEKMLQQHPEIDTTQTLMVNLVEFGDSALNFMVYTFTKTTNWVKYQAIQQDVFLKIIDVITSHGAECAFPTSTLHVPEGISLQAPVAKRSSVAEMD